MTEQSISIERMEEAVNLFGLFDENIRIIEQELGVTVVNRESNLKISGDGEAVMLAVKAIQGLLSLSARGEAISQQNVRYIIELVRTGNEGKIAQLAGDVVCVTAKGKPIKAKTIGQRRYVEAIKNHTVTLGVGPAGTGKTYLAVAAAVAAFREKQINRIILTRPGTCSPRWTPISGPCTMRCLTCWGRRPIRNTWSGATSRWPPWPICGGAPWTTPSSSWTRPRTPAGSR